MDKLDFSTVKAASAQALTAFIDPRFADSLHLAGLVLYVSQAANPPAKAHARLIVNRAETTGVPLELRFCQPSELIQIRQQGEPRARNSSEAIELAKRIIDEAARTGVSDIHFSMEEHQLVVEYRRDGDIVPTEHVFDTEQGDRILSALYTSMSAVADSLFKPKEAQDANIAKDFLPPSLYSARIATSPLPNGPLMVIRLQYKGEITKAGANLGDLNVEPEQVKILEELLKLPDGLILMVGPTGSGKTTTLQKILASLHTMTEGKKRIITVEDPVEIPIPGAMQTAVTNAGSDSERGSAFANAVRRTMRLDPDIVMVGEMRDEATAQSTIRAALTGHLAFSTLHAKSTSHTLARLADLGVRELDLKDPEMIRAVMFQALLKRLCDECKVPANSQTGAGLWSQGSIWSRTMVEHLKGATVFCRSTKGCIKCDRTGYRGRTPVLEVIKTDEEYLELSFDRRRREAIDHIRSKGMITIYEHALLRIRRGEVDPRDAEDQLGELLPKLPKLSPIEHRQAAEMSPESTHLRALSFPRKLDTSESIPA